MKLFSQIIHLFFPETCLFCKAESKICCDICFSKIPLNVSKRNNILSIYHFSRPEINQLIWKMKYHHTGSIAKLFAATLASHLSHFIPPLTKGRLGGVFLIPIPLNQDDKRLHNHAELLAQEIKHNLTNQNVIILNNLLIKNSKQKQSHTKNRQERLENISGTFTINPTSPLAPLQKRGTSAQEQSKENGNIFIIIDDVTTSGATINEARHTLSQHLDIPASQILAVTIAH